MGLTATTATPVALHVALTCHKSATPLQLVALRSGHLRLNGIDQSCLVGISGQPQTATVALQQLKKLVAPCSARFGFPLRTPFRRRFPPSLKVPPKFRIGGSTSDFLGLQPRPACAVPLGHLSLPGSAS